LAALTRSSRKKQADPHDVLVFADDPEGETYLQLSKAAKITVDSSEN
jgi:hypothetical protein